MMPTTVPGLGNVGVVGASVKPAELGEGDGSGGALVLGAAAAKLLMDRQRKLDESGSEAPKVEERSDRDAVDTPPPTPGFESPDIPEAMTPRRRQVFLIGSQTFFNSRMRCRATIGLKTSATSS